MMTWLKNGLGWLIRYWFDVAFVLVCMACLLSFFGQKGWSMDVLASFRLPFILAFAGFAVVYVLRGTWRQGLVCLLLLGINVSQWVFYLPQLSLIKPVDKPVDLKILQFNVWKLNREPNKVYQLLDQEKPDVVALEEYTRHQDYVLSRELKKRFPYAVVRVDMTQSVDDLESEGEDNALYSRLPLDNVRVWVTQHDHKLPKPNTEKVIVATIRVKGQPVDVMVMHTASPTQQHRYYHQKFHMAMLEDHLDEMAPNVVLMGDLNATPWSWTMRRLLRQTGLKDSNEGVGIWPTWPRWLPLLPLDQVLYKGRLQLVSRRVLPAAGSDHLPVVATFHLSATKLPVPSPK
jgi:vancomycin resistance protein VanJ